MKQPPVVTATQAQLDELLAKAKPTFSTQQYELLEGVLGTFVYVMQALQNAKTSLKRFRQMLFGARTESMDNVLRDHGAAGDSVPAASASPITDAATPAAGAAAPPPTGAPAAKQPPPGHGRNGAQAYRDSPVVDIAVPALQTGDPCPECTTGRVYDSAPKVIVKVIGQPPLAATIYKLQQLRCRLCDALFTAPLPALASAAKYDHSCASMLAVLRYGSGLPFYRLEGLQANLNVPLPDATQWDIVAKAVPGPRAACAELLRQAAQAQLLHNDDTPGRILSLMRERARAEAAGQTPVAKAINTSGIVAVLPDERKVVLFFTGHAHAGQNLTQVLAHRAKELAPPLQMCDALAANLSPDFATVLGHCLAHGRRQFVAVAEHFPSECRYVLEVLAEVYAADAHCKREGLSPAQRLMHHQAVSGPPMHRLHQWLTEQLAQRRVEPNSSLGGALRYLLNHWQELTLFLRQAGAPLDNNLCERVLKRAIRHRKNSLFYKTRNGAEVGDIYMSLIHTCELGNVNAFAYLQALQIHAQEVVTKPALWLPWNYREQLPGSP
jgi:hypothetical protein